MSVVLVTGGTGTFGSKLVPILSSRGHQVRVISRRPGLGTHQGDLTTGAGLAEAAAGVGLVVHAATDSGRRLGHRDLEQTGRLLTASSGCRHLLYLSIVGVDAIPLGYYRTKLACEQLIMSSAQPSTILRATQFHELLDRELTAASRLPVAPIPLDLRFQSIAAEEVAARAADLLDGQPLGRAPDIGGPQVLTSAQIVATWRALRGRPRVVVGLRRLPGRAYRGFAAGRNTCPDHRDGIQTWEEYVRQRSR